MYRNSVLFHFCRSNLWTMSYGQLIKNRIACCTYNPIPFPILSGTGPHLIAYAQKKYNNNKYSAANMIFFLAPVNLVNC